MILAIISLVWIWIANSKHSALTNSMNIKITRNEHSLNASKIGVKKRINMIVS